MLVELPQLVAKARLPLLRQEPRLLAGLLQGLAKQSARWQR